MWRRHKNIKSSRYITPNHKNLKVQSQDLNPDFPDSIFYTLNNYTGFFPIRCLLWVSLSRFSIYSANSYLLHIYSMAGTVSGSGKSSKQNRHGTCPQGTDNLALFLRTVLSLLFYWSIYQSIFPSSLSPPPPPRPPDFLFCLHVYFTGILVYCFLFQLLNACPSLPCCLNLSYIFVICPSPFLFLCYLHFLSSYFSSY